MAEPLRCPRQFLGHRGSILMIVTVQTCGIPKFPWDHHLRLMKIAMLDYFWSPISREAYMVSKCRGKLRRKEQVPRFHCLIPTCTSNDISHFVRIIFSSFWAVIARIVFWCRNTPLNDCRSGGMKYHIYLHSHLPKMFNRSWARELFLQFIYVQSNSACQWPNGRFGNGSCAQLAANRPWDLHWASSNQWPSIKGDNGKSSRNGVLMEQSSKISTLWLFNIAMENGPFIDDVPVKTSIYEGFSMAMSNNQVVQIVVFQLPCLMTGG